MAMNKVLALGLLALACAAVTTLGCDRNSPCSGGECCSEYGYCGTGGSYCGKGCQSGPCYPQGKGANNLDENVVPGNACSSSAPCSGGQCCSEYGYCGTGGSYCGKGCQSGPCYPQGKGANDLDEDVVIPGNACSSSAPCSGGQCCSEYGYCGTGGSYCGKGCQSGPCYPQGKGTNDLDEDVVVPGNACSSSAPCSGGQCCSEYGYCGTGGSYCGKGCQSGPCYPQAKGANDLDEMMY